MTIVLTKKENIAFDILEVGGTVLWCFYYRGSVGRGYCMAGKSKTIFEYHDDILQGGCL